MTRKQTQTAPTETAPTETAPVLDGGAILSYLVSKQNPDLLRLALALEYGEWQPGGEQEPLAIGRACGLAGGYVLRYRPQAERLLELITTETEVD